MYTPPALPMVLIALALAACSSDDDDDSPTTTAADSPALDGPPASDSDPFTGTESVGAGDVTPLEGRWASACTLYEPVGVYQRATLEIAGNTFAVVSEAFADETCATEPTVLVEADGTFVVNESSPSDGTTAAGEVNQTFESATLTPLSAEVAARLNAIPFCDRTDFAQDVGANLAGCAIVGSGDLPVTEYDRFVIDGDTLYLGAERGDSPETRPEEVDFAVPYSRVP